jgi:hypothetical protein
MLALPPQTTPSAPAARPLAPKSQTRVSVAETVTVTPALSESRTHLLKPVEDWGWCEVRDYVVTSIEARFGAFPRDQRREHGIFTRFTKDYGPDAGRIARYAFETCDGWWMNATVSVNRFCRNSDPYFAQPILARLNGAA